MITKNYYRLLAHLYSGANGIMAKNYLGNNINVNSSDARFLGWASTQDSNWNASMKHIRTSINGKLGVLLGDGDTPPTPDDYKLAGNIITGFTYTSALNSTVNGTVVTLKAIYTITNTSDTETTIKEIGLLGAATNTPNENTSKILLDRTVLDTPVTIPAGGIGRVDYTITFNLPTAT